MDAVSTSFFEPSNSEDRPTLSANTARRSDLTGNTAPRSDLTGNNENLTETMSQSNSTGAMLSLDLTGISLEEAPSQNTPLSASCTSPSHPPNNLLISNSVGLGSRGYLVIYGGTSHSETGGGHSQMIVDFHEFKVLDLDTLLWLPMTCSYPKRRYHTHAHTHTHALAIHHSPIFMTHLYPHRHLHSVDILPITCSYPKRRGGSHAVVMCSKGWLLSGGMQTEGTIFLSI